MVKKLTPNSIEHESFDLGLSKIAQKVGNTPRVYRRTTSLDGLSAVLHVTSERGGHEDWLFPERHRQNCSRREDQFCSPVLCSWTCLCYGNLWGGGARGPAPHPNARFFCECLPLFLNKSRLWPCFSRRLPPAPPTPKTQSHFPCLAQHWP